MKVIRFKEINSTNTYLKDNYQKMENLSIVVADHQTDGRGRLGRTWVDNDEIGRASCRERVCLSV